EVLLDKRDSLGNPDYLACRRQGKEAGGGAQVLAGILWAGKGEGLFDLREEPRGGGGNRRVSPSAQPGEGAVAGTARKQARRLRVGNVTAEGRWTATALIHLADAHPSALPRKPRVWRGFLGREEKRFVGGCLSRRLLNG